MSHEHEPAPDFVERLEWQIRREVRRQDRFEPQRPPLWRRRWLRTAALVVLSVLAGYAGATAAQDAAERRERELLELQSRNRLDMAELQLRFADDQLGQLRRLARSGDAGAQEQLRNAQLQRRSVEQEAEVAHLDLEELRATGRPPRHDLVAPLVGGRDLVRARLELRLDAMQVQHVDLLPWVADAKVGVATGTPDSFEVAYRQFQLERMEREMAFLRRSLELRDRFLRGELDEAATLARRELLEARMQVEGIEDELELARLRLEAIDRADDGEGDPGEQATRIQAEYQVEIAQLMLEAAERRLQILRDAG